MPTYEYLCTSCENQWEEIQKISEDAIEVCPKCGKSTAKRQISGGNFILKGGGWYADLYSSTGNKKSSGDGAASSGSTGSAKSETKTESAPKKDAGGSSGGSSSGSSGSGSSGSGSSSGGGSSSSGGSSGGASSSGSKT